MLKASDPIDPKYISDLKDNRMLVIQDRYYGLFVTAANLVAIGALAWITGDLVGAFVIGFLLRTFVVHHSTWFINSLAHMWGAKPYSSEHSAVNNFILAVLTLGEGYHNYHHTFAGDYRNGVRWYQFDPPKYLIWFLSKLGLAWDLKRTDPLMIKKKLVQADHKLLMSHLTRLPLHEQTQPFADAVEKMSEKISATIVSAKAVMDRYRSLDRRMHRGEVEELRSRFRALKTEIARDLKTWRRLCRLVLSMQPGMQPAL
jgi:stearoyl-CoA desaturase (delta-9 desaturase)